MDKVLAFYHILCFTIYVMPKLPFRSKRNSNIPPAQNSSPEAGANASIPPELIEGARRMLPLAEHVLGNMAIEQAQQAQLAQQEQAVRIRQQQAEAQAASEEAQMASEAARWQSQIDGAKAIRERVEAARKNRIPLRTKRLFIDPNQPTQIDTDDFGVSMYRERVHRAQAGRLLATANVAKAEADQRKADAKSLAEMPRQEAEARVRNIARELAIQAESAGIPTDRTWVVSSKAQTGFGGRPLSETREERKMRRKHGDKPLMEGWFINMPQNIAAGAAYDPSKPRGFADLVLLKPDPQHPERLLAENDATVEKHRANGGGHGHGSGHGGAHHGHFDAREIPVFGADPESSVRRAVIAEGIGDPVELWQYRLDSLAYFARTNELSMPLPSLHHSISYNTPPTTSTP